MELKDILKALEKLKNNKDKIDYINKIIKEIKDKELIEELKELIKELEEDLEEKLDNVDIPLARRREIELDEVESDIEVQERQVARQRPAIRPDIILPRENDERETRYEAVNANYKPASNAPTYQTSQTFSNYENMSLQSQVNTKLVEEILVKERDFDVGQVINDFQREEIRDTIDRFLPNASTEEKIRAEQQVIYDMKFKNKDLQYIAKIK